MTERRFTGTWHEDGSTDCSEGRTDCVWENANECFHCGTPILEHVNEDGSYILVKPLPASLLQEGRASASLPPDTRKSEQAGEKPNG